MKNILILFFLFCVSPLFATGIGNGATAPCDNATLSKYTGTANVEINWEPNTINLNWYNGDEKLTVANASQTCTYDGMITVPTQPTKPGYTFNGWKVIRVPGGYTELEYLQSSGTQYIDTGIKGDQDTKAEIKFVVTSSSCEYNAWYAVFGARESKVSRAFNFWAPITVENNLGANFGDLGGVVSDVQFSTNTTYVIELSKNRLIVNNASKTISQTSDFTTPTNIVLFNINGGEHSTGGGLANSGCGGNRAFVGNIYYFRLYENNDLVRNFIPARRNSDGVLGMYDTITGQFFTNAGTGTFIAGPVVQ